MIFNLEKKRSDDVDWESGKQHTDSSSQCPEWEVESWIGQYVKHNFVVSSFLVNLGVKDRTSDTKSEPTL